MGVRIKVKVQPGSRNYGIKYTDGVYFVRIKKPPVEGKANEDLINFVSDKLGIRKSSVKIVSGIHSKLKIIEISENLSEEEIQRRLR
ncbi:MAG: DUF167 domain-containing protein [bacterium]|nr:DUF167 domain-containing protein [bacterium]